MFSERTNFSQPKLVLFPESCIIIGRVERVKQIFETILAIIFWHFWIIPLRPDSPQVKRYLLSSISNLVHELPHELPNVLKLRILGNYKILEKCQIRMETQPSAQSSFQKLNVDNSCKRTRKIRYYIVKVLSNFTAFFEFVTNIFSRIVWGKKCLAITWPLLLHSWTFGIYSVTSKHFSNHEVNIKQVSSVKSSNFNGFVLEVFFVLGLGQNLHFENFQFSRLVVFWMN